MVNEEKPLLCDTEKTTKCRANTSTCILKGQVWKVFEYGMIFLMRKCKASDQARRETFRWVPFTPFLSQLLYLSEWGGGKYTFLLYFGAFSLTFLWFLPLLVTCSLALFSLASLTLPLSPFLSPPFSPFLSPPFSLASPLAVVSGLYPLLSPSLIPCRWM